MDYEEEMKKELLNQLSQIEQDIQRVDKIIKDLSLFNKAQRQRILYLEQLFRQLNHK